MGEKRLAQKRAQDDAVNDAATAPYSSPPSVIRSPPGLLNVGDTCYFNAVIQVLYHIPHFRQAVIDYKQPDACMLSSQTDINTNDITNALRRVFIDLSSAARAKRVAQNIEARRGIDYVNPQHMISILRDKTRHIPFDAEGQQDSHEFLRFLLDTVNNALRAAPKSTNAGPPNSEQQPDISGDVDNGTVDSDQTETDVNTYTNSNSDEKATDDEDANRAGRRTSSRLRRARVSSAEQEDRSVKARQEQADETTKRRKRFHDQSPSDSSNRGVVCSKGNQLKSNCRPPARATPNCAEADVDQSARPSPKPSATKHGESASNAMSKQPPKSRPDPDAVPSVFQGGSVTRLRCCECEIARERPETFLDISVPVALGRSLSGALSAMSEGEKLRGDDKYACDTCGTRTEAERRILIAEIPPVFTIHLMLFRFTTNSIANHSSEKVQTTTPCPFRMNFSRWCTKACKDMTTKYLLSAVIVHEGISAVAGHYYSYVLKKDEKHWYLFDDRRVKPVTEDMIRRLLFRVAKTKRTAYILFYSKDDG